MTEIDSTAKPTTSFSIDPNGVVARVFLAFLTTAGIFYINIMPALVSGLKEGLGFTNQQAGFVSSANLYGAAFGALLAVFVIKHIRWKPWCYLLLVSIFVLDGLCILIDSASLMIAVRGFHGLVGGLLVGIGFGVMSRTEQADKSFGYLLFVQWGLGGLGLMVLPGLVPEYGTSALFIALLIFTGVTMAMMPFLPDYPLPKNKSEKTNDASIPWLTLGLTIAAIFLFQGANMGLFAYIIGMAKNEGLSIEFISPALAMASWIALIGAFAVIVIGTKYGRLLPLIVGIVVTGLCSWALHFSEVATIYLVANVIIGITWAFVLPYMFGICSELDKRGQLAALGGFASKMGLASGPMVAALLLGEDNYTLIINVAVVGLLMCVALVALPARTLDVA
ncbi:MFS transporter [Paraferrimonas haliotis]|uniref:MFS transporter n=1 Tax=Paraferrimonas haliotis TaxID=2013866 RepID=A0AA37TW52_9GAMM|nr:MFS transporter [Paraferrimonas haliotis]GLS83853.1 MFS transporter [Paraferrimonas haliotis]GLS83980.1 MFS transporter [Paraferrimonas haliotis]